MAQYKFGSKEAFSRRMATDGLWRIKDWMEVLPEITYSNHSVAWFIKSRASTLLSPDQRARAAEREPAEHQPFHKKALGSSKREVSTEVQKAWNELARLPKDQRPHAKEWAATRLLREKYGPEYLASYEAQRPEV
jgi:hypothetical protein